MAVAIGRRGLVLGGAMALACSRSGRADGSPVPPVTSPNVRLLEWDFGAQPFGHARAVVVVPSREPRRATPGGARGSRSSSLFTAGARR